MSVRLLARDPAGRRALRLPEGATVLLEPMPHAATAAVAFSFPVGSRDEPDEWAGASHLLEHMAFKGPHGGTAGELDRAFEALGAEANAWTSEDSTVLHATVLPESAAAATTWLAVAAQPRIDEADLEIEREVVIEEIWASLDDPEERATDLAHALAYAGHPLARPVLGTHASVAGMTSERLRAWRDRHWRPERLTVCVAGRFEAEPVIAALLKALAAWTQRPVPTAAARPLRRVPPTLQAGRVSEVHPAAERVHAVLFAPGLAATSPDRIAAAVWARTLGEPGVGALHYALVDPGLADHAELLHEPSEDFGTFAGGFACAPEAAQEVQDRFLAELQRAQERPADAAVWRRAARTLASDLRLHAQRPAERVEPLLRAWSTRGRLHDPAELAAQVHDLPPAAAESLRTARPLDRLALALVRPPANSA